jgi:putative proteasome-type protease
MKGSLPPMTYCLGIVTKAGLVMASDSRTNAGYDQVNTCRKMYTFVQEGERVFVLLASGSLSCTQSVITLLRRNFDKGEGLAQATSMYDAARVIGVEVRRVAEMDRPALERDDYKFNVHFLLGGQVVGEPPTLFLIYPQGNPLQATEESPYLQIGETKYGRPILDRGIRFEKTTLEEAAKYALLSLDSTMKSNVTVGPPIDLLAYETDQLSITHQRRFLADDSDLMKIGQRWQQALRVAVAKLPNIRFAVSSKLTEKAPAQDSIQLVETPAADTAADTQPQQEAPPAARVTKPPGED